MELIQGVRTKVVLTSLTKGAVRVPLAQSFNYTPKITQRDINEFDNLEVAQIITSFDGVDISFDYLDSNSKLVDAMFADVDPASAVVLDDPSNYKMVNVFANMKGIDTGLIVSSVLAKACRAKGSPYTEPVKEEAKVTRDLAGTNVIKVKGAAILYTRILASVPDADVYEQSIPPNAYLDKKLAGYSGWSGYSGFSGSSGYSGAKVSFDKTLVPYNGASGYDFWVLKNGEEVTLGYTMTSTAFEVTDEPLDTDVWEVFGLYVDA